MATKQSHEIELKVNLDKLKKAAIAAKDAFKSIGKVGTDAMKGIGLAAAGTAVSVYGLFSSLGDLEKGLARSIQFQSTQPYRKLATDINLATNGIIDMTSALEVAQRGMRSGINEPLVKLIGKYSANLKLAGGETTNLIDLNRKLLKVAESGQVDEELRRTLGDQILSQMKGQLNVQDKQLRQRRLYNILLQDNAKLEESSGDAMNSKMAKFLGMVKALKDESTGAFSILKGFGKATASILAPVGAGLAGMLSNPITGLIGTGLGALSSATITAVAVKVVQAFTGEAEKGADAVGEAGRSIFNQVNFLFENLGSVIEAFLKGITGGGGEVARLSDEVLAQGKAIGISEDTIKKTLSTSYQVGQALSAFSDSFIKFFDLSKIGDWLKSMVGIKPGEQVDIVKIGENLGSFFGRTVSGILDAVMSITKEDINDAKLTVFAIADFFKGIAKLIAGLVKAKKSLELGGESRVESLGKFLRGGTVSKLVEVDENKIRAEEQEKQKREFQETMRNIPYRGSNYLSDPREKADREMRLEGPETSSPSKPPARREDSTLKGLENKVGELGYILTRQELNGYG